MADDVLVAAISSLTTLAVGVASVWATLRTKNLELAQLRDSNESSVQEASELRLRLRHSEERLKSTETDLSDASAKHAALLGRLWTWQPAEHNILLDGPKCSGKSTLVMRWANPTLPYDKFKATAGLVSIPMHLCSELDYDARTERRHQLQFHDVAGEEPQFIASVIKKYKPEVAILVVNPLDLEETERRFTSYVLKIVYGDADLRQMLKGILIYVSRADEARTRGLLDSAMRFANSIKDILQAFYRQDGALSVIAGDARTNEGIVDALAFLARRVGVHELLPTHPSAEAAA